MSSSSSGAAMAHAADYNVITRLDTATGFLTLLAGRAASGFSGDNGPALSAQLNASGPSMGVAVDSAGNLYIADTGNHRVREVSKGIITTIAGNGTMGFSGDNGPAMSAQLNYPAGVAVDSAGNVYISDFGNNRIRKVSNGVITTVAGGGTGGSLGDNGPATSARLSQPIGVAVDAAGNLYIADNQNGRVRKVTNGTITTIAGNGGKGIAGDGGPAANAPLTGPQGVALDAASNLYIAEAGTGRIRKVANGMISTIAGEQADASGVIVGFVADVQLFNPTGVAVDSSGNVYFPNGVLLKLSNGAITTVAGGGVGAAFGYDGTCTNTAPPVITSVTSASAYGGYSYFAPGSWLEIKGTNLIDPSDPRLTNGEAQWTAGDFDGATAPTLLDGVSVGVSGAAASIWYLSPTQLNVQVPGRVLSSSFSVQVTNCRATSVGFDVKGQYLAPGFLAPANYSAAGTQYMVATFASDGAYVLSVGTGAALGLNSRPAKPGDLIVAYGIGFGEVTPAIEPGTITQLSNALVNPVSVSFGSTKASVSYAGLAPGFVGLYEFYIAVPAGLSDGDYPINSTQTAMDTPSNPVKVPQTMYLTVHN